MGYLDQEIIILIRVQQRIKYRLIKWEIKIRELILLVKRLGVFQGQETIYH
jgi:hypothetical protein